MESAKFQRDTKGMVNMSMVVCDKVYISPHIPFCKLIHTSTQYVLPHIYFSIKLIYLIILSLFSFFPECVTYSSQLFLVTQTVKNLPVLWETRVWSLGRQDPLEKGMKTHSSILAWRIPCTEEHGRLQFMGSQRVRQEWGTETFTCNRGCRSSSLSRFYGFYLFLTRTLCFFK